MKKKEYEQIDDFSLNIGDYIVLGLVVIAVIFVLSIMAFKVWTMFAWMPW